MARQYSVETEGLEIQIKHSGDGGEIETVTDSIVALIEGVNLDEAEDAVRVRFYGGVLKALTTHYGMDCPSAEEYTYLQLLEWIDGEVGVPAGLGCKFEVEEG